MAQPLLSSKFSNQSYGQNFVDQTVLQLGRFFFLKKKKDSNNLAVDEKAQVQRTHG